MIKYVNKIWGGERWMVNEDLYCAKILELKHGFQCSLHYHVKKDETFYCLKGTIKLEIEKFIFTLATGQQKRIRPGERHRFTSITSEAEILEVSTHHEDSDSYRIEIGGLIAEGINEIRKA